MSVVARYSVLVRGVVQGVGFRPFVYRLATELGLVGFVKNAGSHVDIDVEGDKTSLDEFITRIHTDRPPMARITGVEVLTKEPQGWKEFSIVSSETLTNNGGSIYIPPDTATCVDCRAEMMDPANRRYTYPFTNCTNCGPRYTIITGVPYDRDKTTMEAYRLCQDCLQEYTNPGDRRYHAEPIACPICGPWVSLIGADGQEELAHRAEAIAKAREILLRGHILAVKGLGGYHLACNALDGGAVDLLRKRKARDEKPFAVMASSLEVALKYCFVDEAERRLLESPASPIVLLEKRKGENLPPGIAPGNPRLGVMLPYTPLHLLLFDDESLSLLVMTSGNISGEPIRYKDAEALTGLRGIADGFLVHNREIHTRVDDSVVRITQGQQELIRRSRGYVPMPISVGDREKKSVLACGGQLKNTFCINKGNDFYLSHHIGDMENLETLEAFEKGIELLQQLLSVTPHSVAYDLHPNYLTTQYALSLPLPSFPIQHHRAHVASCIADNELDGEVIGVAFDGTGYGEDGNIWGGEFFVGEISNLVRIGHLEYVTIPGGDSAIVEPWKTAYGYIVSAYGFAPPEVLQGIPQYKQLLVSEMLRSAVNTYSTSSAGRLFDAASAISGVRAISSYEGQAAIELEHAGAGISFNGDLMNLKPYEFAIQEQASNADTTMFTISIVDVIKGLVEDRLSGIDIRLMAARFHETIACMILKGCLYARDAHSLDRVVLSGGVFQNSTLVRRLLELLGNEGFAVYRHQRVPANDGGLALGQAVIATELMQ